MVVWHPPSEWNADTITSLIFKLHEYETQLLWNNTRRVSKKSLIPVVRDAWQTLCTIDRTYCDPEPIEATAVRGLLHTVNIALGARLQQLAAFRSTWTPKLLDAWKSCTGLAMRTHECTRTWWSRRSSNLSVCVKMETFSRGRFEAATFWRHDLPQHVFRHRSTVPVGWILNGSCADRLHVFPHDWGGGNNRLNPQQKCENDTIDAFSYASKRVAYVRTSCNTYLRKQAPESITCYAPIEPAVLASRAFWKRRAEVSACETVSFINQLRVRVSNRCIAGVFVDNRTRLSPIHLAYAAYASKLAGGVPIFNLPLRGQDVMEADDREAAELEILCGASLARDPATRRTTATPIRSTNQSNFPPPKVCLAKQPVYERRAYLYAVYGAGIPESAILEWNWESVDIIWVDKLDNATRECLLFHRTPGVWTAHEASGFYLPPIGSKMEYPVIWVYHDELACAGQLTNHGGHPRNSPLEVNGSWVEVFHYFLRRTPSNLELEHPWLYRARGSGVWYWTGRMIVFEDTADLARYLGVDVEHKGKVIKEAAARFGSHFTTLAFAHHVDSGYQRARKCVKPVVGWSSIYFYLTELVNLNSQQSGYLGGRCPPVPMRSGWPGHQRPCVCDPYALAAKWPQLRKDRAWQLPVIRCQAKMQVEVER